MSAPIRPLPVEAAPQRTESDETKSTQPGDAPLFGDILNLHLEDKPEKPDKSEKPKEEPSKKPPADAASWAMLGLPLVLPDNVPLPSQAPERGKPLPNAPQLSAAPVASDSAKPTPPPPDSPPLASSLPNEPPSVTVLLQQLTPATETQKISPTPRQKQEEIAGKTPETGENLRGIPDAKQPPMLLTTEKQEATSSPEQHPRFDLSQIEAAVTEQEAPVLRPSIKPVEHPIEFRTERIQDTFSPALRIDSSHVPTETPRVADIRAVAVVDSIREHVQILRVSQQNELQVVLRPDAQTELFLQIRHIDGQIHLQARCERGDFNWLDSQWSAVQNSLANQGVRVEPLQAAFRAQDSFSSTLMHDERGSQREQRPANLSFEQEIPKQTKSSSRPTSSGPRARGWQSWA